MFTTASVLTANPAPLLTGVAYELARDTPFFDSLRKSMELVIPRMVGKTTTDKLNEKLTKWYDRLCKYPWAVLYFKLAQRDLPKHMKIAIRNYWVLRKNIDKRPGHSASAWALALAR
jgi:hypothetical protein